MYGPRRRTGHASPASVMFPSWSWSLYELALVLHVQYDTRDHHCIRIIILNFLDNLDVNFRERNTSPMKEPFITDSVIFGVLIGLHDDINSFISNAAETSRDRKITDKQTKQSNPVCRKFPQITYTSPVWKYLLKFNTRITVI